MDRVAHTEYARSACISSHSSAREAHRQAQHATPATHRVVQPAPSQPLRTLTSDPAALPIACTPCPTPRAGPRACEGVPCHRHAPKTVLGRWHGRGPWPRVRGGFEHCRCAHTRCRRPGLLHFWDNHHTGQNVRNLTSHDGATCVRLRSSVGHQYQRNASAVSSRHHRECTALSFAL